MKILEKPWGKEEILETNKFYTLKKLTMLDGHRCSLQYHKEKLETIYVLSGSLTMVLNNDEYLMPEGTTFTIQPGEIHRMQAKNGDAIYLESSTSQLDDVVRIEDDYFRKEIFKD